MKRLFCILSFFLFSIPVVIAQTWIRINQLGYGTNSKKIAVLGSKDVIHVDTFQLIDSATNNVVYTYTAGEPFGAYGPFEQTYRLDFSGYKKPGVFFIKTGKAVSPSFKIDNSVYDGTADFCLKYMRQQQCGFNPFLKDSCHTHDGYTVYAPMPDGTHIDEVGGWHDASDYLQYVTTSANATYHLLAAYRDFPKVFTDQKSANGLDGSNGIADVLDEAKWGLDWLIKMHPDKDLMFDQIADDRDHHGMRLPKEDSFYNKGYERPVYFVTGEPQGLFKYKNRTTGTSSTAAKFSSAFALASQIYSKKDPAFATLLSNKATTALAYAYRKLGTCQTAPGTAPYFYEEDNWVDDMELAFAALANAAQQTATPASKNQKQLAPENTFIDSAYAYAHDEPITPWLGADTAKHYQWYPFINLGHYELAKQLKGNRKDTIIQFYKQGIERVWAKAKQNAFYRGVPFIWCSNNLTTSFAIQCYWYRKLSGDSTYAELEQACFDWLFGCNPWGTSMVYGLPSWGDTPTDPHSSFTHIKNYPIDGGLIDGPVYTSIFGNLKGLTLYKPDAYEAFQSDLAVYHDDYGDYSTNEPTMDGTASLIYLLAAKQAEQVPVVKVKVAPKKRVKKK